MAGTDLEIAGKTPPEPAARETEMRTAAEAFADDQRATTLLVGRRLGRKEVFESLQKLLTVSDLEDLKRIKESKEYRGLQFRTEAGELLTVTRWEDYCRHFEGRSHQLIDNDLSNYEEFGASGFSALRTLGIGPAKMRQMRLSGLPEDDTTALVQLAQAGDKESVLDLVEELIVRQRTEKQRLTDELQEATDQIQTKDQRAEVREREIERLNTDLRKARRQFDEASPSEVGETLKTEVIKAANLVAHHLGAELNTTKGLSGALIALHEHCAEHGVNHAPWVMTQLDDLQRQIDVLRLRWSAAV